MVNLNLINKINIDFKIILRYTSDCDLYLQIPKVGLQILREILNFLEKVKWNGIVLRRIFEDTKRNNIPQIHIFYWTQLKKRKKIGICVTL